MLNWMQLLLTIMTGVEWYTRWPKDNKLLHKIYICQKRLLHAYMQQNMSQKLCIWRDIETDDYMGHISSMQYFAVLHKT